MNKLKLWGFLVFAFGAILMLPNKALAEANFDELLTDGKLVVHSALKPTDIKLADDITIEDFAASMIYEYSLIYKYSMMDNNYYLNWEKPCNEDYTKCTIYYGNHQPGDPSKEVEITYAYDNNVKAKVDSLIKKLDGKDTFSLNDIELITFLKDEKASLVNYSSEFKKAIDYKNININTMGGYYTGAFYSDNSNIAQVTYDDTLYYYYNNSKPIASAKHIIYVDDNATDVLAAVKAKLTKAFGTDFNVVETGTVDEFLVSEEANFEYEFNYIEDDLKQQYNSAHEYAEEKMIKNYINEDGIYHFVYEKKGEKYYTLTINDCDYNFLVVKDSSKINNNTNLITSDARSNITISTLSSNVPSDAVIKVAKLTDGADYEKIIKTLNVKNSETFDLALYSSSLDKNITEGNFEVKIPISDTLKDKSLIVYYVDENNKIEEHEVTIKDGYAIFTTDHFSIYTLAEKPSSTTSNPPEESTTDSANPTTTAEPTANNPQTGDSILVYVGLLFTSTLGVIGLSCINLNNKKKIKNN